MVHLSKPGRDLGYFCTDEVRPRTRPTSITGRTIAFPKNHYKEPPNVAGGFKMLDLSHKAPAVRANLVGSDITPDSFHIALETWDQGVLNAASAQWIEHKSGSKECHFGQFDTRDVKTRNGGQEWKKRFKFPLQFKGGENPAVVCWLNRLDMANGEDRNWRINAYATNITPDGATFHIDTWGDSELNGAAMCWIAFPAGKKKVDSGTFSTSEVRPWHEARSRNSKRVRFKEGWFDKPPTVLVGLNLLDMAGNADMRIQVDADDVDNEGFTWHLDTWVSPPILSKNNHFGEPCADPASLGRFYVICCWR
jgi:hypothetical protein